MKRCLLSNRFNSTVHVSALSLYLLLCCFGIWGLFSAGLCLCASQTLPVWKELLPFSHGIASMKLFLFLSFVSFLLPPPSPPIAFSHIHFAILVISALLAYIVRGAGHHGSHSQTRCSGGMWRDWQWQDHPASSVPL